LITDRFATHNREQRNRRTTLVAVLKSALGSLCAYALSEQVWFAACYVEGISCFLFGFCSNVCYFTAEMTESHKPADDLPCRQYEIFL
jgi:hypothetical protein